MEAQLEENKKELLWVRVLMGRPRPGQRRGLGGAYMSVHAESLSHVPLFATL